ncbi:unnamed protein product [Callosobruchus maculatus]|uniref:Uncharacterized protein n=1 Tax=Callosobruchus maculatus TaxID=64391 RepID=A0A653CZQ8_CALMS|nr:unnamed protein product [Callosobruchus maculatus]
MEFQIVMTEVMNLDALQLLQTPATLKTSSSVSPQEYVSQKHGIVMELQTVMIDQMNLNHVETLTVQITSTSVTALSVFLRHTSAMAKRTVRMALMKATSMHVANLHSVVHTPSGNALEYQNDVLTLPASAMGSLTAPMGLMKVLVVNWPSASTRTVFARTSARLHHRR